MQKPLDGVLSEDNSYLGEEVALFFFFTIVRWSVLSRGGICVSQMGLDYLHGAAALSSVV